MLACGAPATWLAAAGTDPWRVQQALVASVIVRECLDVHMGDEPRLWQRWRRQLAEAMLAPGAGEAVLQQVLQAAGDAAVMQRRKRPFGYSWLGGDFRGLAPWGCAEDCVQVVSELKDAVPELYALARRGGERVPRARQLLELLASSGAGARAQLADGAAGHGLGDAALQELRDDAAVALQVRWWARGGSSCTGDKLRWVAASAQRWRWRGGAGAVGTAGQHM
jgi:hypothetical protein